MSDELIRKSGLIDTLNGWLSGEPSETLFGMGYDGAVRDIIKLIESEKTVNAVELPCKIKDKIYEPCRCGRIHVQTVKGFTVSDHVEMVNCETKNYSVREIGNTAFFTREEAERALEELRNE